MGSKCIIKMMGPKTIITDPVLNKDKDFTFDFSYWSHDKKDEHFADNPKVFRDLGVQVLNNAWDGYNVCLFAYGQTGAGKSYSMVGYGDDRGIVPLAMQEMFKRVAENSDRSLKYLVEASMLEIYNEKVRDLFNPADNPPAGLKVRDHPSLGPYVEGLSKTVVTSYDQIQKLMDQGTLARTVASTAMNATSSRAHTVFQIIFTTTQSDAETGKSTQKVSKINLVDLAGSERISKTGAAGDTLKEGIGINKSLSALGDCIEKLAKAGNEKKGEPKVHVPYRNSTLTWLLKQSLGGNAKTIMIAAISPADDNYEESMSTLRYADRAKQIKNKAVVNEDPNAKMIRELKAELGRLRAQVGGAAAGSVGVGDGAASSDPANAMDSKEREEFLALKEKMEQNERIMKELNMSWEEKMKQSAELQVSRDRALGSEDADKRKSVPHIVNLHKDPLMAECLAYFFPSGTVRVLNKKGKLTANPDDIVLTGLALQPEHCHITNSNGTVSITPLTDARVFINGALIRDRTELKHDDRLVLGSHLFFRYVNPSLLEEKVDEKGNIIRSQYDWEFAQREVNSSAMASILGEDEEAKLAAKVAAAEAKKQQAIAEKKMQEFVAKMEEEKKKQADVEAKQRKAFELQMADMERKRAAEMEESRRLLSKAAAEQSAEQEALEAKLREQQHRLAAERTEAKRAHQQFLDEQKKKQHALEAELAKQKEEAAALKAKQAAEQRSKRDTEDALAHMIPMVNEANVICEQLKQPLQFNVQLSGAGSTEADPLKSTEITVVRCRVVDKIADMEVNWDMGELTDYLAMMREIHERYLMDDVIDIPKRPQDNPFILRANGPQLLGSVRIWLQPLFFLIPIAEEGRIIDFKGITKGKLEVDLKLIPGSSVASSFTTTTKSGGSITGATGSTAAVATETTASLDFDTDNVSDLNDLKGERVRLWIRIPKASELPVKCSKNVYVQYKWLFEDRESRTTPVPAVTRDPMIKYERKLTIDIVTDAVCDYLQKSALEFQVWGEAPPPVVVKEKRRHDPDDPDDVLTEEEIKEEKLRQYETDLTTISSLLKKIPGASPTHAATNAATTASTVATANNNTTNTLASSSSTLSTAAAATQPTASTVSSSAAPPNVVTPTVVIPQLVAQVEALVEEKTKLEAERLALLETKAKKEELEAEKAILQAKLKQHEESEKGQTLKQLDDLKAEAAKVEALRKQLSDAEEKVLELEKEAKNVEEENKADIDFGKRKAEELKKTEAMLHSLRGHKSEADARLQHEAKMKLDIQQQLLEAQALLREVPENPVSKTELERVQHEKEEREAELAALRAELDKKNKSKACIIL